MTEPKKPEDEVPDVDTLRDESADVATEATQDDAAETPEAEAEDASSEETSADDTGSEDPESVEAETGEAETAADADPETDPSATETAEDTAEAVATSEGMPEAPDDAAMPDQPEATAATAAPEPKPDPKPQVVEKTVVEKRGGVVPGFIGGAIAVAGAFIAAPYVLPEGVRPITDLTPVETEISTLSDETSATLASLTERLEGLAATAEGAATPADVTTAVDALRGATESSDGDLSSQIGDVSGQLTALSEALDGATGRVGALEERLSTLERRPFEDSADPAVVAAMQAYVKEIEDLRAAVEAQTSENQRMIDEQMASAQALVEEQTEEARRIMQEAAAATEAAREDVEAQAAAAAEAAAAAQRQKAVADIRAALEAGEPYETPLAELETAPDALASAAADGVVTLAVLQAEIPDLARASLAAAREAAAAEEGTSDTRSFFQKQLGLRSLAPREGDDPDAVLSRVEAAVLAGEIDTALTEIEGLPAGAQAPLADWVARATARLAALAAIEDLAAQMATN